METSYDNIVAKINGILNLLQGHLRKDDISEVISYYEVGEVTLAVEMMSEFIIETGIELDKSVYNSIRELCLALELDENYWKYLKVK